MFPLPLPGQHNVGSCSHTQLVDGTALVPDTARALNHGNELLSKALGQTVLSTSHISPFDGSGQDPLHSSTSSLPLTKRNRDLKRDTTSSSTSLTADAHKRRN
jgi:hypothetical protein